MPYLLFLHRRPRRVGRGEYLVEFLFALSLFVSVIWENEVWIPRVCGPARKDYTRSVYSSNGRLTTVSTQNTYQIMLSCICVSSYNVKKRMGSTKEDTDECVPRDEDEDVFPLCESLV